ncbi:MAG TPA: hypothetical protein VGC41_24020 [Kofleriaceae bacterium]
MRQVALAMLLGSCFVKPSPQDHGTDGPVADAAPDALVLPEGHNYMFVSTTTYPLTDAGTTTERMTNDCRAEALGHGLPGAESFIALVSHTGDPPIQTRLGTASGFYRTDDRPIANELFQGGMFYPPSRTVSNVEIRTLVFTGLDPQGGPSADCHTTAAGAFGFSYAVGTVWVSEEAARGCDAAAPVYCVGTMFQNTTISLPAVPASGKIAWLSTMTYDGKSPSDKTKCVAGGLSGFSLAYLSSGALLHVPTPAEWYRADGLDLGDDLESPLAPITTNANGAPVADDQFAWFGGPTPGTKNCMDWQLGAVDTGLAISIVDPSPARGIIKQCDDDQRIVCFQDP